MKPDIFRGCFCFLLLHSQVVKPFLDVCQQILPAACHLTISVVAHSVASHCTVSFGMPASLTVGQQIDSSEVPSEA